MSVQDLTINPKLKFFCQKVLPLVYDNSLSYYEAICKIASTTNMLVDDVNEIIKYIKDLNIDEEINIKVTELFNEYINSSEFDNLIKNMISSLNFCPQKVNIKRLAAIVNDSGLRWETLEDETTDNYYAYAQGLYLTQNDTYLLTFKRTDSLYPNNNNALLVEYSKEGTLIKSKILPIQHANSIAQNYNTKEIYICGCYSYVNNTASGNKTYFIINYDDFSIKKTITVDQSIITEYTGIAYDNVNNKLYGYNKNYIEEINLNTPTNAVKLESPFTKAIAQSGFMGNGVFYFCYSNPNIIVQYDLTGKKLHQYFLDDSLKDGKIALKELESVYVKENKFYIVDVGFCQQYELWCHSDISVFDVAQTEVYDNRYHWEAYEIYCDYSANSFNGSGTRENPYLTIGECLEAAYNRKITNITVLNCNMDVLSVYNQNVTIVLNDNTIYSLHARNSQLSLTGLLINSPSNYKYPECNIANTTLSLAKWAFNNNAQFLKCSSSHILSESFNNKGVPMVNRSVLTIELSNSHYEGDNFIGLKINNSWINFDYRIFEFNESTQQYELNSYLMSLPDFDFETFRGQFQEFIVINLDKTEHIFSLYPMVETYNYTYAVTTSGGKLNLSFVKLSYENGRFSFVSNKWLSFDPQNNTFTSGTSTTKPKSIRLRC